MITVAKSAGFCFGVKRALEIAHQTIKTRKNVYILGDIVHNEDVIKELEQSGIKKIKKLGNGKSRTLLVRAHGVGKNLPQNARRLGYQIVDATCPMVKEIHKIAKNIENSGRKVIIIGDKNHDEVRGIIGQLKTKAIVIESPKDIQQKKAAKITKAGIVVQSTQNIDNVLKILENLKTYIRDLKFFNTICQPTRIKQEEIKKIPLENEVVIVIGSKTSANTRRLYEISKSLNTNTFWVQSRKDLKTSWFQGKKKIGITAGASTPDRTINEIIKHLETTKAN